MMDIVSPLNVTSKRCNLVHLGLLEDMLPELEIITAAWLLYRDHETRKVTIKSSSQYIHTKVI